MEAVTFVGGGNMASALIAGLVRKGWSAGAIRVVEIDPQARERLERELGVTAHADLASGATGSGTIVLAVKPQQMQAVARGLAPLLAGQLVVTIAAGIRHSDLTRWLDGHAPIVRAMPNTPALVLAGITGLYAPATVSKSDRARAESILAAAGATLWLEREEQMDAVTAISGSGPAYVFYFVEALQEAAEKLGLSADVSRALALQTFVGAAKLASESPESAGTLRERVTSKGGTTERALAVLGEAGVRQAIVRAAEAAAERSQELGDALGDNTGEKIAGDGEARTL